MCEPWQISEGRSPPMFEILMYLFENYMDGSVALKVDQDTVVTELEQIGFTRGEIGRDLDWLDGLNRAQEFVQTSQQSTMNSIRHYAEEECTRISMEGRGFLLYLEQLHFRSNDTRNSN